VAQRSDERPQLVVGVQPVAVDEGGDQVVRLVDDVAFHLSGLLLRRQRGEKRRHRAHEIADSIC